MCLKLRVLSIQKKIWRGQELKNAIVMDVDAVGAEITFQANLENGSEDTR